MCKHGSYLIKSMRHIKSNGTFNNNGKLQRKCAMKNTETIGSVLLKLSHG